jgi:hypothetical protein
LIIKEKISHRDRRERQIEELDTNGHKSVIRAKGLVVK